MVPRAAGASAAECTTSPDPPPFEHRLLALEAAVALLRPATQGSRPALEELADEIAHIRQLGPVPGAEAGLRDAEELVLQIDARIPASSIRVMPLPDAEQAARYAGLLAHHAEGSLPRMDRVDILVTRLCASESTEGRRSVRPRADLDQVLKLAGTPCSADSSRAIAFFAAASQRLPTLGSLNDVFEGGLYLDTRGYKVSLKQQRLDPDVLYAAAAFNLAFESRLDELQHAAGMSDSDLAGRLRAAEQQIDMLFGEPAGRALEEAPAGVPSSQDRQRTDPIPLPRARRPWRNLLRGVGIAVALAGSVFLYLRDRGSSRLVPLPAKELARLSPLLESGSLAGGADSFLVGRIPSSRWMLMSRSERKSVASELRNRLMRRKITAAVVFRDDNVLAIQIEQGRVLAVE